MRQQEKQGTRPTPSPGRALRDGLHDPARDAAQREWRSRTLPLSLADRARVQAAQAAIEARPPSSQVPQYRSSVDPRKARGRPTPRDSLSKRPRFFPLGLPVRRTPAASVVTTCRASWRWTAVLVHALRQALCPSPGLLALIAATSRGDLHRSLDDGPRSRVAQPARFRDLLKRWILG